MQQTLSDDKQWFALRALYNREMRLKEFFDNKTVENYVPMRYVKSPRTGARRMVAAIHCLIFVRCGFDELKSAQNFLEGKWPFRIYTDPESHRPMAIPSQQMRDFIDVTSHCEAVDYVDSTTFKCGDRVRVTAGAFEGCCGVLEKVGRRNRLVVSIAGVACVATAFIPARMIEKI